nr:hypothetical protein BDOA9_0105820 [Bradyrhizobium sp. DOA9]
MPPPACTLTDDPPAELELESEPLDAVEPVVPELDAPAAVMLPSACFSTVTLQVAPELVFPVFSMVSADAALPVRASTVIATIALFIAAPPQWTKGSGACRSPDRTSSCPSSTRPCCGPCPSRGPCRWHGCRTCRRPCRAISTRRTGQRWSRCPPQNRRCRRWTSSCRRRPTSHRCRASRPSRCPNRCPPRSRRCQPSKSWCRRRPTNRPCRASMQSPIRCRQPKSHRCLRWSCWCRRRPMSHRYRSSSSIAQLRAPCRPAARPQPQRASGSSCSLPPGFPKIKSPIRHGINW